MDIQLCMHRVLNYSGCSFCQPLIFGGIIMYQVVTVQGRKYELRKEFSDSFVGFNVDDISDTITVPKQRLALHVVQ
jgi:hypothetical protein